GLGGPVFALIEAPNRGFTDPLILVSLFGGLAFFGAFVLWELHDDAPMLPLRLFRLRNFTFANIETFAVYSALSTLTFFLVLFLQQVAGYSPFRSGLATVPITVVMFFLSPRVGSLSIPFPPAPAGLRAPSALVSSGASGRSSAPLRSFGSASSRPGSTTGQSSCRRCSCSRSASR